MSLMDLTLIYSKLVFDWCQPFPGTSQQVTPGDSPEVLSLLQGVGQVSPQGLRQEESSNAAQAGEGAHDDQGEYSVNCTLKCEIVRGVAVELCTYKCSTGGRPAVRGESVNQCVICNKRGWWKW